ncbi:MAG: hypothetical protein ACRCWM_00815 [Sarcina sp.]
MADELTFKNAQKGESKSFNKLIEPIQENLYKIAFIYMKDEGKAIDIFLSSVSEGIKYLNRCKSHERFEFWLVNLLLDKCKDELIKSKKVDVKTNDLEIKLIDDAVEFLNQIERKQIVKKYENDVQEIFTLNNMQSNKLKRAISKTLSKLKVISKGA